MGRSRDIADMLGKTELANTNNEALITTFDAVDSAYVSSNVTPALVFYSTLDSLPVSGLSVGQQAYVSANSRLYISDGSGWYNKALITLSPTMTLSPSGTITLANDGVTTSTVTIVAVDSDTPGSGLTYSVESDGNGIGKYAISQDSSVFTIRPLSEDSGATSGTFTLTFKTSDGVNLAFDSADFSLTFSTIVDSSAETILLVKATGNSLDNDAITYQNSSDVSTGFTETGDPQASTFSPYRSGGYSIYFDGSGDYMNPKTAFDGISPHWSSTTDDWTIEFWIYRTGTWTSGYPIPIGLSRSSDGYNTFLWGNAASASNDALWLNNSIYNLSDIISDRTWTHVALVYNGTNITVYYDGVSVGSTSFTPNAALSALEFGIGAEFDGANGGSPGNYFGGYMTDIRVSWNVRYTTTFTPPTDSLADDAYTVFLLRKENGYLKDVSSGVDLNIAGNTHTVPFGPIDYSPWTADDVGGSVYFDGTSDYMQVSNSSDFAFGTGDFTVEAWVNYTTFSGSGGQAILSNGTSISSGTSGHWYLTAYGATDLRFGRHGVAQYTSVTSNLVVDAWNHIAVTRSGTTVRIFVNGVSLTTSDTGGGVGSYDFNNTSGILMIGEGASFSKASGHIADVRIIKGTAQYTSNFTPPTAPLSHVTNTNLLMNNKSDANVYDVSASKKFDLVGGTVTDNSTRKFTTSSSIYFPGPSAGTDGIVITDPFGPMSKDQFLTSDFTIEFWVYPTSWFNGDIFLGYDVIGGQSGSFLLYQNSGMKLYADNDTDTSWDLVSNASIFSVWTNSWKHFAMTYDASATTLKFYLDGVLQYTNTGISGWENCGSDGDHNVLSINQGRSDTNRGAMVGYIQDVRVSKSVRYTTAFTPPTAEFEL